jgi:hypothetical protein
MGVQGPTRLSLHAQAAEKKYEVLAILLACRVWANQERGERREE